MTTRAATASRSFDGAIIKVRRDRSHAGRAARPARRRAAPRRSRGRRLRRRTRIMLLHQYRHPVRQRLWELPAGLLDVAGEPASRRPNGSSPRRQDSGGAWDTLVDTYTSPGMSDEAIRIFLARGVGEACRAPRPVDEEADSSVRWVASGRRAGWRSCTVRSPTRWRWRASFGGAGPRRPGSGDCVPPTRLGCPAAARRMTAVHPFRRSRVRHDERQ